MENKNKTQTKVNKLDALVVEDNKLYLTCWKLGLNRECNRYDEVTNERDALDLLGKNKYDIVLTDGAFPEHEGLTIENPVLKDYRGKNIAKLAKEKGAYVIGLTEEPEKLRCKSIDKLMKKPVEINKLKKIFQNVSERRYE